jgi:hypothetical protein
LQEVVTREVWAARLDSLGGEGDAARRLDDAVEVLMLDVVSLSALTSPLAVDYLDRLQRPLPALTPAMGAQIVGRSYVAHMAVESDPARYGASDVPVVGTFPPPRNGYAPPDLLNRVVKVSRRSFEPVCAVAPGVWDGFVCGLVMRAHLLQGELDVTPDRPRGSDEPLPVAAVDGLARFGWVLRQVDIHYGSRPERRAGAG